MIKKAICGNGGPRIRSDCEIALHLTTGNQIRISLESKVETLYGNSIRALTNDILGHFGISGATVEIKDSGAMAFVIAARLEAAIKKLMDTDTEYLPPMMEHAQYESGHGRFRFSRLYLPGNTPGMMLNAGIHKPDGIILDLEDSVAPQKKHEARFLIRNALRQLDFMGAERMVRINQMPGGIEDLKYLIPHNVHVILIPKCEHPDQITTVDAKILELQGGEHKKPVFLMPIVESALGVERAFDIACCSTNIVAMAIGLEDYTADIGVQRTTEASESQYARLRIVNACKAAGIQPIDSVFSDVADTEGLRKSAEVSRSLGFEGIGCIHPRQVPIIHEVFMPTGAEIQKAQTILMAFSEAEKKGLGVVSLGTKMIDAPVVKRAMNTIQLAVHQGIIPEDWEKHHNRE